jgi:hypothetical protein
MDMSCDICAAQFTVSKRIKITCRFCKKHVCVQCIETYLLGGTKEPHCMYCNKEFPYDFMIENFKKSFIKRLKTHSSNLSFEKEKARLPEAQQELTKRKSIYEIDVKIRNLKNEVLRLKRDRSNILYGNGKEKEHVQIIRNCPESDCRGFLNSKLKCGICENKFCSRCHDKLIENAKEHVCDEEKVKTVDLIKKQCKNCPKCGVSIFKISGCNQMWCTSCNTAWDWKTRRIETKPIHNPHYFEYLNSQGLDVPNNNHVHDCNVLPTYYRLRQLLPSKYKYITNMLRFLRHIEHVEISNLDEKINNNNLDLRIKFLHKEITEKRFKSILKRRNTIVKKSQKLKDIYSMFLQVVKDLLNNMVRTTGNHMLTDDRCEQFILECDNILKYTNDNFEIIKQQFSTKYSNKICKGYGWNGYIDKNS